MVYHNISQFFKTLKLTEIIKTIRSFHYFQITIRSKKFTTTIIIIMTIIIDLVDTTFTNNLMVVNWFFI